jgi:hypothetical protein
VNLDHVGYKLSEDIAGGKVIFKSDTDEKIVNLIQEELISGDHPIGRLKS